MILPAPPACLTRPYSANQKQKGGTLIAEDTVDSQAHRRRMADPDGYRPDICRRCGGGCLHAHDFRERRIRGAPDCVVERVRRYRCAGCRAVWMVLPLLLARHLHRRWDTVQAAMVAAGVVGDDGAGRRVAVPATTRRRWTKRLRSSARVLVQVLAGAGAAICGVLERLTVACTRAELVDGLAGDGLLMARQKTAQLAGWIHRLVPGLRLA